MPDLPGVLLGRAVQLRPELLKVLEMERFRFGRRGMKGFSFRPPPARRSSFTSGRYQPGFGMPIVMLPDPNKVYDSDPVIDTARSSSDICQPASVAAEPNEAASARGPLEAPTKQGPRPCSSEHGVPNRRRNEKDNARRDTRSKRCSCACPAFATQIGDANAAARHQQGHGGTIRLEAWLYAVPSDNALSATVWDCFKITGAVNDEGGGPTWTDEASYTAPNSMTTGGQAAAAKECAAKEPAGGFGASPAPEPGQYSFASSTATPNAPKGSETGLTTIYAVHTLIAQKGDIYITYAGDYNFTNRSITVTEPNGSTVTVAPYKTGPACSWLITGGTGAYSGLEGSGMCAANAQNTFPWVNHTTTGSVWWGPGSGPS